MAFADFLRRRSSDSDLEKAVARALTLLVTLNTKVDQVMATQAELEASLVALGEQLAKVSAEIAAEVAALEAAIVAAGSTTPGIDAALAAVKARVDALDALNQDAPTP